VVVWQDRSVAVSQYRSVAVSQYRGVAVSQCGSIAAWQPVFGWWFDVSIIDTVLTVLSREKERKRKLKR